MSPELGESLVQSQSYRIIEDFRRWLILRTQYVKALSNSILHGENLSRPDKSIRFHYKNSIYDVIDEFIDEKTQLFTIRRRDINTKVIDFDFWEEEVHICAVKASNRISPSILYGNIYKEKIYEKNTMHALSGIIKFLTFLR